MTDTYPIAYDSDDDDDDPECYWYDEDDQGEIDPEVRGWL